MSDTITSDFDKDLLRTRISSLRDTIKDSKATPKKKLDTVLQTEEIILMLVASDHPKVDTMWSVFRPMAWVMTAAILAIIGLAVSGRIVIDIVR